MGPPNKFFPFLQNCVSVHFDVFLSRCVFLNTLVLNVLNILGLLTLPTAFSTSVNHALSCTRRYSQSLYWFLDFIFSYLLKGGLFLLFSQNSWSPLSYHLLDLHSHSLFHLQLFPLSANILGLLYPKNKQNTQIKPSFNPEAFSNFIFSSSFSCFQVSFLNLPWSFFFAE